MTDTSRSGNKHTGQPIDDQALLQALVNGDEDALRAIFYAYQPMALQASYRITGSLPEAEDIVQEVFLTIWSKRQNLTIKTTLGGYIRKAVVNRSLNALRRSKRLDWADLEGETLEASDLRGDQHLEFKEFSDKIGQAIEALPEKTKVVFVLSRFEDMSNRAIAEELAISVKTVENQMSRALRILRSSIKSE